MKERPVLCCAPMVRALLREENPKSLTRRIVKPQPNHDCSFQGAIKCDWYHPAKIRRDGEEVPGESVYGFWNEDQVWKCPYGAPGDRLWVRETFKLWDHDLEGVTVEYAADAASIYVATNKKPKWLHTRSRHSDRLKDWRPSIFMPRWASRITLEVLSVRVERLQDISEEDAKAEGVTPASGGTILYYPDYRSSFEVIWKSINGTGSWDSNPFVWRIEFRKIQP
jgi:hypothetical protein